jgi:hypothetical protein
MSDEMPSELSGFQNLMPGVMYSIAVRHVLERGLAYLLKEAVEQLWWDAERQMVMAHVMGTETYTTGIRAVSEKKVRHECNCPAHNGNDACEHVVAVLGALFALTQDRVFTHGQPDLGYLNLLLARFQQSLKTGEDQEAETGAGQVERELQLLIDDQHRLLLESRGNIPHKLLSELGLIYPGSTPGSRVMYLWSMQAPEQLAQIAWKAVPHGLPVVAVTDNEERIRLTGHSYKTVASVLLDLRDAEMKIEAVEIPIDEDGEPRQPILDFDENICLDSLGDILETTRSPARGFEDMADPFSFNWSGDFRFLAKDGFEELISVEEFNSRSLSTPHPALEKALRHLVLLSQDQRQEELPRVEPEILVDVKARENGVEVVTQVQVEGVTVSLVETEGNLQSQLAFGGEDSRLTNAKGRVKKLVQAALLLPTLETAKEKKALIKETVEDQLFKRQRLQKAARRWLKPFEKSIALEKNPDKKNNLCLLALPGIEKPWVLAQCPSEKLLHLWLGLARPTDDDELLEVGQSMMLNHTQPGQLVAEARVLCAALGARLRFKGKTVVSRPVEIEVEARQSDAIDWFELRSEVRCGSLTIPREEWEALIRGELLLEDRGKVILPELSRQEAVKHLQRIFTTPTKKRGKRSKAAEAVERVPRLQMLDWLALRNQGVKVNLPAEAEQLFESLLNFEEIEERPLPKGIQADLRGYQHRGFDWLHFLYQHRFGACLADDMGLGKTLQAIALLAWREENRGGKKKGKLPHLAVVPPTLVFNWQSEIARFCPSLKTAEYTGGDRDLQSALRADVVITTYDLVRRDIDSLVKQKFDIVIFDETQTLKNLAAQRTKAAGKLVRRFTLCLTGTPMENHVGEYYSIMNLALPGIFGDYDTFRKHLRESESDSENGQDALLARARPFILRRTKEKILKELPPKVESDLHLDMSAEQKEIYTRTVGEVRAEVLEAYEEKTNSQAGIVALAALTRLRQVCISPEILGKETRSGAPKMDYLKEQLRELRDEGHAVLVFSQFTRALDLLQAVLAQAQMPLLRLDGKTPAKKRKTIVQTFQEDDQPHIFLISLKAGGVGLNLTRANYVYHLDPWWNPAVENQAADRAHRIGQKQTVFIQRLLMRHSIEEKMMALKNKKQELFNSIIEAPQAKSDSSPLITRKDFEYLLGTE